MVARDGRQCLIDLVPMDLVRKREAQGSEPIKSNFLVYDILVCTVKDPVDVSRLIGTQCSSCNPSDHMVAVPAGDGTTNSGNPFLVSLQGARLHSSENTPGSSLHLIGEKSVASLDKLARVIVNRNGCFYVPMCEAQEESSLLI